MGMGEDGVWEHWGWGNKNGKVLLSQYCPNKHKSSNLSKVIELSIVNEPILEHEDAQKCINYGPQSAAEQRWGHMHAFHNLSETYVLIINIFL